MTGAETRDRRAWVIGSINQDIVAFAERLPRPGETVLGISSALYPGGKGANQAVAIARLGGRVSMIGRVGRDAFGTGMKAFLGREGVNVAGVAAVDDAATGVALITVDAQSENSIVVVAGANGRWDDGFDAFEPARGDVVVCQMEIPDRVVGEAFRRAREAGVRTVFNPSPYGDAARGLIAQTDVLVVNEIEAGQMLGVSFDAGDERAVHDAAIALIRLGPDAAVITLGARGVVVAIEGKVERVAGVSVKAVDTTGAGDCFTGALVAELLHGADIVAAARFAVGAAAISVTRRGAAASFPMRTEVLGPGV